MKKTMLTTMLMLCITAYSFCQTAKNIQTTTIKGRGNAMDTIITKKNELSFNKTYLNSYKRDEAVVEALKPYLVSDMVTPGNYSHPAYLARIKEAKEKLPLAKADLLARMKSSQNIREKMSKINITNETDLNTISFVYTPVYYPTPNIVFFKNGDNIAKYYNLARGGAKIPCTPKQ